MRKVFRAVAIIGTGTSPSGRGRGGDPPSNGARVWCVVLYGALCVPALHPISGARRCGHSV
jgi:hypothetical protein